MIPGTSVGRNRKASLGTSGGANRAAGGTFKAGVGFRTNCFLTNKMTFFNQNKQDNIACFNPPAEQIFPFSYALACILGVNMN